LPNAAKTPVIDKQKAQLSFIQSHQILEETDNETKNSPQKIMEQEVVRPQVPTTLSAKTKFNNSKLSEKKESVMTTP
jgi:hypothetical protein